MTHWGWYWGIKKQHVARTLCTQLVSIDSFKLFKNIGFTSFNIQPFGINAERTEDHFKLTYPGRKDNAYRIPIDKLPCNYGGMRYYFKCPLCQKRMRILYFSEQRIFLCRVCLNLGYPSQKLRPTKRYEHMNQKIKKIVKDRGGNLDIYKKPPRMHQKTYRMLRSRQFYYESKTLQASNAELRQWYPKIAHELDDYFDYVDESKDWRRQQPHL
jgi:hypothetical protein